jgi:rhodanese-related sulfurtransferase
MTLNVTFIFVFSSVLAIISSELLSQGKELVYTRPDPAFGQKIAVCVGELSDSANGFSMEAIATSEEWYSGKEKWTTKTVGRITTDFSGKRRHLNLDHEMNSLGVRRSSYGQSSLFVEGKSAFNYKVLRLSSDDKERHMVIGFAKKFGIGNLFYANLGYVLGVCESENKKYSELIDLSACLAAVDQESGIFYVKAPKVGYCTCEIEIDNKDFLIRSMTIIKEADDKVNHFENSKLSANEIAPNESTLQSVVKLTNFVYSNRLLDSVDISNLVIGSKGTTWTGIAHVSVTRREPLGDRDIPGLIPQGVSVDHPRDIHVFDDPNIRYKIDVSGAVKKAIDPRPFEKVFGRGESNDQQTFLQSNGDADESLLAESYLRGQETRAHCGIYGVMAALTELNVEFSADELLDSKYVGSPLGSSAQELINALASRGVDSVFVENVTVNALRRSTKPIILLLEKGLGERTNHWILFLGDDKGRAKVIDAPRPVESLDYKTLLARWKGKALMVGESSVSREWQLFAAMEKASILVFPLAIAFVFCLIAKRLEKSTSFSLPLVAKLTCVLLTSLALAAAYHFTTIRGLLGSDSALLFIKKSISKTNEYYQISKSELKQHLQAGDVILVDARIPAAFHQGHIDGAINFPVDAALGELEACIRKLEEKSSRGSLPRKQMHVVVYCQSDQCDWDSVVAASIRKIGYQNVSLFSDGWMGWIN